MPYLIPESIKNLADGETIPLQGFCVYLPDDPDMLAAFVGAYQFFTKWVAWERDDSHNAVKVASIWRAAYELTMIDFWDKSGCGCSEDEMDINVNVKVENSCNYTANNAFYCVLDNGDVIVNPPATQNDYYTPPDVLPPGVDSPPIVGDEDADPPPTWGDDIAWEDWASYNLDACRVANQMVEWQYQFWRKWADFFQQDVFTLAAAVVVVVNLVSYGLAALFDRRLQYKIVEIVGKLAFLDIIGDYAAGARDEIAENRQELVCELYQQRRNVSSWSNVLVNRILALSTSGLETQAELSTIQELLSYALPPSLGLWMLKGAVSYTNDNAVSCQDCGGGSGAWVVNYDQTSLASESAYTISGVSESGFTVSGYLVRGSVTAIAISLWKPENYGGDTGFWYMTFNVYQEITSTDDGFICKVGTVNNSAIVATDDTPLKSVMLWAGVLPPGSENYDLVAELGSYSYVRPHVKFMISGYKPAPVTMILQISNFTQHAVDEQSDMGEPG